MPGEHSRIANGGLVRLGIAGIEFAVHSPVRLQCEEAGDCYEGFWIPPATSSGGTSVDIHLTLRDSPPIDKARPLFDGQSWFLFGDGDLRYLKAHGSTPAEPRWLARFGLHPEEATVFCGQVLVSTRDGETTISSPVHYPLDQLLLMYVLASRDGAVLHAAGGRVRDRGYLFAGSSSAGKSTLSRLLTASGQAAVLSDDRMVVREVAGEWWAYGTPWPGEAGVAMNERMPLSAVFFLHHSQGNSIQRCSKADALKALLPVASIPWYERELVSAMLSFIETLLLQVPCFDLHFRPGVEVVEMLSRFDPADA